MLSSMDYRPADLDVVFHALADPTRRAVLDRLGRGTATVGELAAPFDMALPSFMKHISVLERAQLIVSRKNGRVRTCALDRDRLIAAERWFGEQHLIWQTRHSKLDSLLATIKGEDNDA